MTHEQAVSFIRPAITGTEIQYWADLGCGGGTFTKALLDLLPSGSHITAVDRENQQFQAENIDFIRADLTELDLTELDGILIANALHYVADKVSLIQKLKTMFSGAPSFVIIEYDTDKPNLWVPYPISFNNIQILFSDYSVTKVNERRSAYGSGMMYCAVVEK